MGAWPGEARPKPIDREGDYNVYEGDLIRDEKAHYVLP